MSLLTTVANAGATSGQTVYTPYNPTWSEIVPAVAGTAVGGAGTSGGPGTYHNGLIYVPGGYNSGGLLTSLQVFDTATGSWSTVSSIPYTARFNASAVIGDKLYVTFGETSASTFRNRVQVYDITAGTWSTYVHPSGLGKTRHGLAVADNRYLYCVGGTNSDATGTVFVFDTVTNTITSLSHLDSRTIPNVNTTYRNYCHSAYWDGWLYYFRGRSPTNTESATVEKIDLSYVPSGWVTTTPQPVGFSLASCIQQGPFVYFFGVTTAGTIRDYCYRFDCRTDTWQTLNLLALPHSDAAVGTDGNGKFWVAGGFATSQSDTVQAGI